MTELLLQRELEPAARQQRRLTVLRRLTVWWFVLAACAVIATVAELHLRLPAVLVLLGLGVLGAIGALAFPSANQRLDYRRLAGDIAAQHPEIHTVLVTAVEQQRDSQTGRLGYLQEHVINEALTELRRQHRLQSVPPAAMRRNQLFHAGALLLFVIALCGMPRTPIAVPARRSTPVIASVKVTPGDTSIERGSGLVVLAAFTGPLPIDATLVVNDEAGERRIPLSRNLNDPVFGGSIPEVKAALRYHVEHTGGKTPDYTVTVFEYPRLERADASLVYPSYTGLAPKTIPETRRITAVQGSTVDLTLQLNKPVASAKLIGRDNSQVVLEARPGAAQARLSGFQLVASQRYQLQLVDADGRTNKVPAEFAFDVTTNQPPLVKLLIPRGDQRVSSLQEMFFQAEAEDDFGLRGWGLTYSIGGDTPKTIALGGQTGPHQKTNFIHVVRLEDLGVQPDQLVSYYVWAEDFGPDGRIRRTSGDLFFSEVRPFEEIFREGEGASSQSQQQQQQQQQGQSPAAKLAELQKQIINATWKLVRSHPVTNAPPLYVRDEAVVRSSQGDALEQVEALEEDLQEIRMKDFAQAAAKQMQRALDRLNEATNSPAPLPQALAAEQAAYQALLKLQAREFQVMQARAQSRSSRSNAQRNQAQVNQLELKKQQNSYETQKEAEQQEPPAKKAQLEALNRLKELAQRQQDINQRLKELQTELQAAQSAERKEELQRELKRLRDEQRDMLADMDELRQKMEQPQSGSEMAESRRELDAARQEAQRASEALDKQNVPQALASGTRAERQLEQTRDDLRKATSGQFANEMRQMRSDARDLAEKQQAIEKEMQAANDQPKALSDNGQAQDIAKKIGEQKQAVTNVLDQMKRVTEQAEVAEPLLSKQLYDALRRSSQGTLDQSLTAAQELSSRNFLREAEPFEQRAATEITSLARDVEKAAASVLGDETESLRSAKRELDRLTQQLQRELVRAASTNASLSNALAAAGRGTNSASARRGGTNGMAMASSRGQGTNQAARGLASGGTNGNARLPGGTNQQLSAAQGGRRQGPGDGRQNESTPGRPSDVAQAGRDPGQQQSASGQQPAEGQEPGSGQQPAGGQQQQPGQQASSSGGRGENGNPETAQDQSQGGNGARNRGDRLASLFNQAGEANQRTEGGGGGDDNGGGPITGGDYADWSQRLSNVEEMLDRPALRNQLAQARDRARSTRTDFKRHSKKPQWDLVWKDILKPMVEVRERVADELSRRESNDSLAPIDRDPVPGKYGELVRRYYETLGGAE